MPVQSQNSIPFVTHTHTNAYLKYTVLYVERWKMSERDEGQKPE